MMQYCYQLNYDCKSAESLEVDEIADLRPHVDVFMLAERYGISGLKQLALEKFESLAITVLTMNENERHLLKAVRAIYEPSRTANADELRRVAVTICANHVEGFIAGDQTQMALVFESNNLRIQSLLSDTELNLESSYSRICISSDYLVSTVSA